MSRVAVLLVVLPARDGVLLRARAGLEGRRQEVVGRHHNRSLHRRRLGRRARRVRDGVRGGGRRDRHRRRGRVHRHDVDQVVGPETREVGGGRGGMPRGRLLRDDPVGRVDGGRVRRVPLRQRRGGRLVFGGMGAVGGRATMDYGIRYCSSEIEEKHE